MTKKLLYSLDIQKTGVVEGCKKQYDFRCKHRNAYY